MKTMKKAILLASITIIGVLVILTGCEAGFSGTSETPTGMLEIRVPRIAPLLADKYDRLASPSAFLGADEVDFELYDSTYALVASEYIDNTGGDTQSFYNNQSGYSLVSWEVPAGEGYILETRVYNVQSEEYQTFDPSVAGVYGPFDIMAGSVTPVVVVNTPANPIVLTDEIESSRYVEATGSERWFEVTTGAEDNELYIDVISYAGTGGGSDADFDMFVYDADGNLIVYSDTTSDGNTSTDDLESITLEDTIAVEPDTTYYVGVYAFAGGEFDAYFDSSLNPVVQFSKANYANEFLEENQDRITDNVWITRGNSQGLFNAAVETGFDADYYTSPAGTEWAPMPTASASFTDYTSWNMAKPYPTTDMVGNTYSLHLIADDLYFDVTFLSWTDYANGGGFSYERVVAAAPSWASSVVYFEKADYADSSVEENQDRISGMVWLTRDDSAGLYNAYSEGEYNKNTYASPAGTSWAPMPTADATTFDYTTWGSALGWVPPDAVLDMTVSLYVIDDDSYYDVRFTSWTEGGFGGGFSYVRIPAN